MIIRSVKKRVTVQLICKYKVNNIYAILYINLYYNE